MKNFKKVISAVIALAMVISSFTTVSASKFADMADTANYAEAVEVLAALGIVNGIEENGALVFKPENQVTRAEAATMIVGALNMTEDAKASAGTSRFADVNSQAAWAAGYVNVGVAQGFISGYDATSFGPTDNVTYEQLCVMLTKIAGYGEYAAANSTGKWSAGYTSMAASTGINKGVAVADEAALTRGQVAQMIYNTLVTPMLGVAEYSLTGNTYSQLDGKNDREFKTLLSDKFDGYVATVLIDGTPLATALENDEVEFVVKKAAWWPEEDATVASSDDEVDTASLVAEGVEVNANYLQTGKAVFVTNEDDELVMVYFAPTGKTVTKEFAAEDYVLQSDLRGDNLYAASQKIKFGSTSYKMEEGFDIYVNGVEYKSGIKTTTDDVATILDTLLGGAQGTIKMIKEDDAKNYTAIFVEYYEVAKVTAVGYKNDETVISMTTKAPLGTSYDEIIITDENIEEGKVIVSVMRNGAEAELSSIVKGDIIAYATDFKNNTAKTIEDPASIKILATNETATGKVTSVDEDEETHTIDGKEYKSVVFNKANPEIKMSYDLTLDPFGRIFETKISGTSEKYGIVVKETSTGVQLVLADGSTKTYELSSKAESALDTANITSSTPIEDRIVAYTVRSSSNELTTLEFIKAKVDTISYAEYKARTGKLGSAKISESTQIIDARDAETDGAGKASNYGAFSADNFKDGVTYAGYSVSVGTYTNLVVVTAVGTKFNEEIRFAVVRKAATDFTTDEGDNVDKVLVLYNGAEEELLFEQGVYDGVKAKWDSEAGEYKYGNADGAVTINDLDVGDVFFFETNSDGFVDKVYKIYDKSAGTMVASLEKAGVAKADIPQDNKGWSYNLWEENAKDIQLAVGYVVDVQSNSIALTTTTAVSKGLIETALDIDDTDGKTKGVAIFGIDPDCAAYEYDTDEDIIKEIDRFSAFDGASVKASAFGRFEHPEDPSVLVESYKDEDKNTIALGDMNDYANFAVAMIVDGDIVAIYTIVK